MENYYIFLRVLFPSITPFSTIQQISFETNIDQ